MVGTRFLGVRIPSAVRVSVRQSPQNREKICRQCSPVVYAFANSYQQDRSGGGRATYERVLRYPDGLERRIRYPVPNDEISSPSIDTTTIEDWTTLNVWDPSLQACTSQSINMATTPSFSPPSTLEDSDHIPDSPLALLRFLTSDAHKQAQKSELEDIRGSYKILTGCPWPVPKPLYILASSPTNDNDHYPTTHTLRTRLPRSDLEDEIKKLLRKKKTRNNRPIIRCGEIVDGVIAFEDDADAECYGQFLEESGTFGVTIAQCDSHELFRNVRDVKGAVVLLHKGVKVPRPHRLAASVRGQTSLDDDDDDQL